MFFLNGTPIRSNLQSPGRPLSARKPTDIACLLARLAKWLDGHHRLWIIRPLRHCTLHANIVLTNLAGDDKKGANLFKVSYLVTALPHISIIY